VHAQHLHGLDDFAAEGGILAQFLRHSQHGLDHLVGIFLERHRYVENHGGPGFGHVRQGIDFSILEHMHGPGLIAQGDSTQSDFLHQAARTVNDGHVPVADLVFHQYEETADDVPHQFLGSESDGQSDDSGSRDDWGDIHAQFHQQQHAHHAQQYGLGQGMQEIDQGLHSLRRFEIETRFGLFFRGEHNGPQAAYPEIKGLEADHGKYQDDDNGRRGGDDPGHGGF